ncbi:MAG: hypothetical protein OEV64_03420 [Desulfobulbaceae bacterium]|nr:hypothetical protein [Desulfobulbaceae bacterium]
MKKAQLTWFDRVMMNVTFAEAGVDLAVANSSSQQDSFNVDAVEEMMREMNSGKEDVVPAHS